MTELARVLAQELELELELALALALGLGLGQERDLVQGRDLAQVRE